MIRVCPRCLYRGAVLDDGYGPRCLNCAWEPVDEALLAEIAEESAAERRGLRRPRRPKEKVPA